MNEINTAVVDETNVDAAATNVEETSPKKEEVKIPDPIMIRTKDGGAIVNVAVSETVYERYYYSAAKVASGILDEPYRTKTVKLPVSLNEQTFRKTWNLFGFLRNERGYRKV